MGEFNDNSFERDLKCDFPARESFREALLQTLLSAGVNTIAHRRRKIKLEDADLEMLAAAEGEDRASKHLLVDPFEQ